MFEKINLNYKKPEELDEMADKIIELSAENTPATEMTAEEAEFIRKMAIAALSTLNMSGDRIESEVTMAVKNMAEIAFNDEFPDNEASGYDRIYKPLNAVIEDWKEESRSKEAEQSKTE